MKLTHEMKTFATKEIISINLCATSVHHFRFSSSNKRTRKKNIQQKRENNEKQQKYKLRSFLHVPDVLEDFDPVMWGNCCVPEAKFPIFSQAFFFVSFQFSCFYCSILFLFCFSELQTKKNMNLLRYSCCFACT